MHRMSADFRGEIVGVMRESGLRVAVLAGRGPRFQILDSTAWEIVGEFSFVEPAAAGEAGARLAQFMASPNEESPGYTNWEIAIVAHNRENDLAPDRRFSFYLLTSARMKAEAATFRGCLPIDLPMPDFVNGGK